MSFAAVLRKSLRFSIPLILVMTFVACGGRSSSPDPTNIPTALPTATVEPSPTPEPESNSGIVRTAWTKSGDGAGWVLDTASDGAGWVRGKVSDAGGWIWGGVSGSSGWIWDRVTGLPSNVSDVFVRFWRWVGGTGAGERVREVTVSTIENAREVINAISGFSITGFLWSAVKLIFVIALGLIISVLICGKMIFSLVGGLPRRMLRAIGGLIRSKQSSGSSVRGSKSGYGPTVDQHSTGGKTESSSHYDRTGQSPVEVTDGKPMQVEEPKPSSSHATMEMKPQNDLARLAWSRTQIVELRRRVTNTTIIALFDLARARESDPVNYQELMEITGRTSGQVRADFAAFSRICKSVYGDGTWPINIVKPTDGQSNRAYSVHPQYIDWWFEH